MDKKQSDHSHLRMVVIDDDTMLLRSLERAFNELGYTVTAFDAPLVALEWIRSNGADIVLTDIRMPQCDGFQVLEQVKELQPGAEVILITGHGDLEMAVRALRHGAADFFQKPFDIFELSAAIERTARFRSIQQQKNLLTARLDGLSRQLHQVKGKNVMLGDSPLMKEIAANIVSVAGSTVTVLIVGESGTGKELVANAIHQASQRSDRPMLTINCASIPESLFESEMFGHKRGSFTGATADRSGYVEAANGGTLFLDEIGDLPFLLQGKILRLMEQKTYLPVGASTERTVDIRMIAATNHPLQKLVEERKFREDLYYRLSVSTITVPPLRDRKQDIPLLARHFTLLCAADMGKDITGIEPEALDLLASHDYPGNIRELRNVIENAVIHVRHPGDLAASDLPATFGGSPRAPTQQTPEAAAWPLGTLNLEQIERRSFQEALKRASHNVSAAARLLGISRGKLRRRLADLGLEEHPPTA